MRNNNKKRDFLAEVSHSHIDHQFVIHFTHTRHSSAEICIKNIGFLTIMT